MIATFFSSSVLTLIFDPSVAYIAHVIGFTTIDGHGVAGMERAFDKQLSEAATRGQPLQLSISAKIQQAMELLVRMGAK